MDQKEIDQFLSSVAYLVNTFITINNLSKSFINSKECQTAYLEYLKQNLKKQLDSTK
jgi:hypothetical protein